MTTAPHAPSQLPKQRATVVALVLICQDCERPMARGRSGPSPKWCPECRAERNRVRAAARRNASSAASLAGTSRVAGSRNRRDAFHLPPEDHLAVRVVQLRTAVNLAAAELAAALPSGSGAYVFPPPLLQAVQTALGILQSVPVGR